MKVSRDYYKEIAGEIKKITKKQVSPAQKFRTGGCRPIPILTGTIYYEIVLVPGASKKGRYSSAKPTIIEPEVELLFFEHRFPHFNKEGRGDKLKVGKKYLFYTGGNQISNWKEIVD